MQTPFGVSFLKSSIFFQFIFSILLSLLRKSKLLNEKLVIENTKLKTQVKMLKEAKSKKPVFKSLLKTNEDLSFFTGLPSLSLF